MTESLRPTNGIRNSVDKPFTILITLDSKSAELKARPFNN